MTTAPAAAAAAPATATPAATTPATPAATPAAGVMFIGKIPPTCKREDVNAFVTPAGAVKRVAIKKYRRVEHNLYAFVELENPDNVAKACEMLNGKELGGVAVVVEVARRPFPRKRPFRKGKKAAAPAAAAAGAAAPAAGTAAPAATEEKKTRRPRRANRRPRRPAVDAPISKDVAYVGNLPYIVDEEGMKDIFEGCKFIEARVVRRARDNRSKGFGFVTFANEEDRAAAIKVADGSVVEGRKIHVSPARERVERPKAEETTAPAPAAN